MTDTDQIQQALDRAVEQITTRPIVLHVDGREVARNIDRPQEAA